MKTTFLAAVVGAMTVASAWSGPRIGVSVNIGGSGCQRAPVVVAPVVCAPRPVVIRSFPVCATAPVPVFYNWGPTVVVQQASPTTTGFTTVSSQVVPATPIYRVPPPVVIPTQPVVVQPGTSFSWRR